MTNRVDLEPAFVLHSRAYRNSSLIVELFTMRYGRIGVVARSARGPRSRYQGKLQLFSPLLVSWSGRSDLKNMGNVELSGLFYELNGTALLCGFYLNELLMRLVRHEDPYPKIYEHYQTTLNILEQGAVIEPQLRYFEKWVLSELGYGVPLTHDATRGSEICATCFYRYVPERGFVQCADEEGPMVFSGSVLQAFHNETLSNAADLLLIKRLMRFILARYLGSKPVYSREILA